MIPLLVAGGIMAAGAIAKAAHQAHVANKQRKAANKIDTTRPTYNIPGEVAANQAMYRDMANSSRMPGQSLAENNIKAGTANSLNALTQTGGGVNNILAAVGGLNQNQNNSMNDLATQGAQFQLQNKDKYANANNVMAGYRDKSFDYNQNQPYMMNVSRKMALQNASMMNKDGMFTTINNGANSIAGLVAGGAGGGLGKMGGAMRAGSQMSGYPSSNQNFA